MGPAGAEQDACDLVVGLPVIWVVVGSGGLERSDAWHGVACLGVFWRAFAAHEHEAGGAEIPGEVDRVVAAVVSAPEHAAFGDLVAGLLEHVVVLRVCVDEPGMDPWEPMPDSGVARVVVGERQSDDPAGGYVAELGEVPVCGDPVVAWADGGRVVESDHYGSFLAGHSGLDPWVEAGPFADDDRQGAGGGVIQRVPHEGKTLRFCGCIR